MSLTRRAFLSAASGLLAAPGMVFAGAATERRFVFIIQRGAADGLHTVIPSADPHYATLRRALALDPAAAIKLDGSFALHPALTGLGQLHAKGQAAFVHAVAMPYRDRSHFDGQNILESGGRAPYQLKDGWMNRLVALLPHDTGAKGRAIAFAPTLPLALRGPADVASYAPTNLRQANDDLMQRVGQLYEQDKQLHGLWSAALEARRMAGAGAGKPGQDPAALGRLAASFLAKPEGPRLAMIETGGWDTHTAQEKRLDVELGRLDGLIAGLREGLGPVWAQTVVMVATEFGRTAAVNGTGGTDHGTGAVAMLAGGAVQGGRVIADWPGLAPAKLLDGRDLKPTLGLDTLIAQTCAETFGLDPARTARVLFPHAAPAKPLPRLIRA